jgi:hypothetical protein
MSLLLRLLCAAILVGALFRFALPFLVSLAIREPPVEDDSRILVYSRAVKVIVVGLGAMAVAVLTFIVAMIDSGPILGWLAVIGLMVALILPLALEVFFVRIAWDDSNIYTRSPWRLPRTVPLSSVQSCDYSVKLRWYRIRTRGHGIVRLPFDLERLPEESGLIHRDRGIPELLSALPCPLPGKPPRTSFIR